MTMTAPGPHLSADEPMASGSAEPEEFLFDAEWYVGCYPDVADGIEGGLWRSPFEHYLEFGQREGRNPNALFDESFYRQQDPDLDAAIAAGQLVSAADHYRRTGFREGRRVSRWIDVDWYLARHPEAQRAIEDGSAPDLYQYFLREGFARGHVGIPGFDAGHYREWLQRVAGSTPSPRGRGFEGFLREGRFRGYDPSEAICSQLYDRRESEFRRRRRENLGRFLESDSRLRVGAGGRDDPQVSILLVHRWGVAELFESLESLSLLVDGAYEVLVADLESSEASRKLCAQVEGLRTVPTDDFGSISNRLAARAKGAFLLFLEAGSKVERSTIRAALAAFTSDTSIGVVTSRILESDGSLREAGRTLDGRARAMAQAWTPSMATGEDSVPVDVPCASRALLLTPRRCFEDLGGLEERLSSRSFQSIDYCLRLWMHGKRSVVEPRSVVWASERSAPREVSAACLDREERSRVLVAARHRPLLQRIEAQTVEGRWRGSLGPDPPRPSLLYCDDRVPDPQLGSGYPRSVLILESLSRLGYRITFVATATDLELRSPRETLPRDIEIVRVGSQGLVKVLQERRGEFDLVWVSRPINMRILRRALSDDPSLLGGGRLVYDAEAIFALRESRRPGRDRGSGRSQRSIADEISLGAPADCIVSVSRAEASYFRSGGLPTEVVSYAPKGKARLTNGFEDRQGILIVGAVPSRDCPNHDGLQWFLTAVWPILVSAVPDLHLDIVGFWADGIERPEGCSGDVVWHGAVEDLSPFYAAARIFVAPTRYGAGVPLKILDAAAAGVPVVTTEAMAELLGWKDGVELLAIDAAEPETVALRTLSLYRDAPAWESLRQAGLRRVQEEYSQAVVEAGVRRVLRRVFFGASFSSVGEEGARIESNDSPPRTPAWLPSSLS